MAGMEAEEAITGAAVLTEAAFITEEGIIEAEGTTEAEGMTTGDKEDGGVWQSRQCRRQERPLFLNSRISRSVPGGFLPR